jgi:hypothetical protein
VPAADLPATESLKETVARFLPAWHEEIAPAIRGGKRVLIAAHGNSIRALIKYLDSISDKDIVELNIPTGASPRGAALLGVAVRGVALRCVAWRGDCCGVWQLRCGSCGLGAPSWVFAVRAAWTAAVWGVFA